MPFDIEAGTNHLPASMFVLPPKVSPLQDKEKPTNNVAKPHSIRRLPALPLIMPSNQKTPYETTEGSH